MTDIRFRVLTDPEPLQTLKLRTEDQRELETMFGIPANKVLELSRSSSLWTKVAEVDGEIVTVFGLSTSGNPWMVGTDRMMDFPLTVVKAGYRYVKECLESFDYIWNYVDTRNITHIRWLVRMGFIFKPDVLTFNGVEYIYFYKEKPECADQQ